MIHKTKRPKCLNTFQRFAQECVYDRFVLAGQARLFVGAVPMTTAWWDLCQRGLVFLVSHRWLTLLQVSVQFLSWAWKRRRVVQYLWAVLLEHTPCFFICLFFFFAMASRPSLVKLTNISNSSGISPVSGITAALLTCLQVRYVCGFHGCVFVVVHFLSSLSVRR